MSGEWQFSDSDFGGSDFGYEEDWDMGKLSADTAELFKESCGDGGATSSNARSCQPCGCDEGANWKCRVHSGEQKQEISPVNLNEHPTRYPIVGHMGQNYVSPAKYISPVRHFDTGATRNDDSLKFDYEGFINPEALHAFATYMHDHRLQRDGTTRDADNWQKGIPFRAYVKSLVRHTIDLWRMERGYPVTNPDTGEPHTKHELCCALVFNSLGYLKELVDPSSINKEGK